MPRPSLRRTRFPKLDPLRQRWRVQMSWGTKQMDVFGHDHIPPNTPLSRFHPHRAKQRMDVFPRQDLFSGLRTYRQVYDRRRIEALYGRIMRWDASSRKRVHQSSPHQPRKRPRRSVALQVCRPANQRPLEGRAPSRPSGQGTRPRQSVALKSHPLLGHDGAWPSKITRRWRPRRSVALQVCRPADQRVLEGRAAVASAALAVGCANRQVPRGRARGRRPDAQSGRCAPPAPDNDRTCRSDV